jgi:hypothetical protein
MKKYETPQETINPNGIGGDEEKNYKHDAYGMIGISVVTHNNLTLFGSDLDHGQSIRFCLKRAQLTRRHANDWIHAESGVPIVEFTLSQHQFAELITSPNRGDGVPCTIDYAPARGSKTEMMPGIKNFQSKAEILRNDVRDSARKQMEKIQKELAILQEVIDKPSISKKDLKAAMHSVKCTMDNLPSNMSFVVKQAEETLDKAVTSAKIDVEAYIGNKINQLGIEAARGLGLTQAQEAATTFLENNE